MGRRVWVPVVSGPLAPFAAGFASWLASRAYSPSAAADRLYQFDQLSRWLEREGLGAGELTGEQAARFAEARRAAGLVSLASPQSVALPLGYMRQLGTVPMPAPVCPQSPLEELLADYRRYLSNERGLSGHTVLDAYGPAARLFLSIWETSNGPGLEQLSAARRRPRPPCPSAAASAVEMAEGDDAGHDREAEQRRRVIPARTKIAVVENVRNTGRSAGGEGRIG
jgi:hypothetical protein